MPLCTHPWFSPPGIPDWGRCPNTGRWRSVWGWPRLWPRPPVSGCLYWPLVEDSGKHTQGAERVGMMCLGMWRVVKKRLLVKNGYWTDFTWWHFNLYICWGNVYVLDHYVHISTVVLLSVFEINIGHRQRPTLENISEHNYHLSAKVTMLEQKHCMNR